MSLMFDYERNLLFDDHSGAVDNLYYAIKEIMNLIRNKYCG